MYHARFKGTHYEIGFRWGNLLYSKGKHLMDTVPFSVEGERERFSQKCIPFYKEYYPEILEEIRGIADGQKMKAEKLEAVLMSMYCIMPEQKCSCLVFQGIRPDERGESAADTAVFRKKKASGCILARNSDFLTEIEKLYMNCIYKLQNGAYSFQGNTTAFVEMEDGINEYGFAVGLTSVYPKVLKPGINAGMLLRYGLEKCRTVPEFVEALGRLPIASSQTFTAADRLGNAALIECNCEALEVRYISEDYPEVCAVNSFHLEQMKEYRVKEIDDWMAEERYSTIEDALLKNRGRSREFAEEVLSGKHGFLCQYDRDTGKDTVWSVIYDLMEPAVYRCEGNPSRKRFKRDERFQFRDAGTTD